MAAKQTQLEKLHEALAKELLDQIESGTEVVCGEGTRKVSPGASLLNVARQFVKDCGVEVDPENIPEAVNKIRQTLEAIEDDEFPSFPQ